MRREDQHMGADCCAHDITSRTEVANRETGLSNKQDSSPHILSNN